MAIISRSKLDNMQGVDSLSKVVMHIPACWFECFWIMFFYGLLQFLGVFGQ